ncbi:asparaginase [Schinkia azotoformans]|uniref:asparaginase n=1 Tax=Schinkia azotoformans LMG 9581 TaxID=1131731 RepID=K6DGD6_SCHAZ|nr:asparaginase [Schinkia azotoformans]EKN67379.1 asparaginase/glutaminase [Schinkia azotoformans LMG 9581]MEC1639368.1 asparaginase [Schinkia azotoformans]MEC1719681.1 asparaginase [Schinkia azotoformans]MEC1944378.1 asparaginase [Schinkia azotoformans]MED4352686.1 asparaginase [Schinkia azotoformans]
MKKKVALITTGGTIASKEISKGLLNSGAMSGEELAELCQLPEDIEVKIIDVMQKPSMHIDFGQMLKVRRAILTELNDPTVCGIVVTHGTDSMEETAYFLDLTINDSRPIVVTGSQRAPQDIGTDVYSNLRNSIYVAVNEELKNVGVVVVFNERIYSAKYVKKVHASNVQGFESFGYGYLGIIDNNIVSIYQKPITKDNYQIKKQIPRVDIIKCYSGADGVFIEAAIKAGAKGIVLEGVGRGQVSPYMMDAIKKAIAAKITVMVTTSAEEGKVYPAYGYVGSAYDLKQNGVLLGEDYDSKKARIKLAVLLASVDKIVQANFK